MSSQIETYWLRRLTRGGATNTAGSIESPHATFPASDTGVRVDDTFQIDAGGTLVPYEWNVGGFTTFSSMLLMVNDNSGNGVDVWIRAVGIDTNGLPDGSKKVWNHVRVTSNFPLPIKQIDALCNATPGNHASDSAGVPNGQTADARGIVDKVYVKNAGTASVRFRRIIDG